MTTVAAMLGSSSINLWLKRWNRHSGCCQDKHEFLAKQFQLDALQKNMFSLHESVRKRVIKMLNLFLLQFWKRTIKKSVSPNLVCRHEAWKLAWFLISGLRKQKKSRRTFERFEELRSAWQHKFKEFGVKFWLILTQKRWIQRIMLNLKDLVDVC